MCRVEDCEKPVHSKELCQAHYRQEKRRARGLLPPGPKPDPTRPRSRQGKARANEGGGHKTNVIGGTCRKGHLLTTETAKVQTSGYINCRICTNNAERRRRGSEEIDYLGVANKDKTHCKNGHEYAGDNLYIHPKTGARRCLTCHSKLTKQWRLLNYYDLSIDRYEQMIEEQDNQCSICSASFDNWQPHVDHDHDTNELRALLCTKCNTGLGQFQDNPDTLQKAIDYLAKFSKTTVS
jgi:hypothetical protein